MIKSFFLFLFLLPFTCLSQYVITGKVINSADKTPVANASVFLNNAAVGTKTDEHGAFTLTGVRQGQYDLVVSILSFEPSHQNIIVNNDIKLPVIELAPKVMMLQEVRIKPKTNWAKDYEKFKRLFFGNSDFAGKCKIVNKGLPDILNLDYYPEVGVFTASSNDYLEIENKALGYRIRYLLAKLVSDQRTGINYYEGTSSFEDLKGSESQMRKWKKNRLAAYEGSSMHFLRSVVSNTVTHEGFKVLRLIAKSGAGNKNSISHSFRTLVSIPLNDSDFVRQTDVKGEYALTFKDCLYVMYNKKRSHLGNTPTAEWASSKQWDEALITTLIFNEPYSFFDNNGIIINPTSVIFDGNWGQRLVADLLPVDYVPALDN
ncbi:MAG: carboxypeptidase-like regulatory domain-containing protein [Bacteroidota bacterium]|nr:carboxypeptidase-like regulatory domain-containing protein [Bacteroidota bacterium]